MTYATLMAYLNPNKCNDSLLRAVGNLAERFSASVIGISACQTPKTIYGDEEDRFLNEVENNMQAMEERFRAALHNRTQELSWRSMITHSPVSEFIAREARATDLIIIQNEVNEDEFESVELDMPDLVMRAGRPILSVSPYDPTLDLNRVLVAWKDTREAQHAVASALPFLQKAAQVTVVEVAAEEELPAARQRVTDVTEWLKKHNVMADPCAMVSSGTDAERLGMMARERNADLIVAGAYGHSRFREWALGGVTNGFLFGRGLSTLTAH